MTIQELTTAFEVFRRFQQSLYLILTLAMERNQLTRIVHDPSAFFTLEISQNPTDFLPGTIGSSSRDESATGIALAPSETLFAGKVRVALVVIYGSLARFLCAKRGCHEGLSSCDSIDPGGIFRFRL